jgi:uncharacterized membrane-anchored protein
MKDSTDGCLRWKSHTKFSQTLKLVPEGELY